MLQNGSAKPDVPELDAQQLAPFEVTMPPSGPAHATRFFAISQTDVVTWVVDGYPYSEPKAPIIYGNKSDGWAANTTLHMPYNSTIDIIMSIANGSMDAVSWTGSCLFLIKTPPTAELRADHCITLDGSPNASART